MSLMKKMGGARSGAGRKKFEGTPEQRQIAANACKIGVTVEDLATILDISEPVCRREFAKEIERGKANRDVNIKGALYKNAMKGNPALIIFYLKTQCGWKDTDSNMTVTVDKPEQIVFNVQAKPSAATND